MRAVSGSFALERRAQDDGKNKQRQEQTKAKNKNKQKRNAGGPSTAAAKYAASGRDDGNCYLCATVGMTGYRLRAPVGMTG